MEETMIQTTFKRLRGCIYTINMPRPADQNVMDNVAQILKTLRNREFEVLVATFTDKETNERLYDGLDCVEALYGDTPGTLQVNAYYRRDNPEEESWRLEWYGAELKTDEAVEFFRKVLVECAVPKEMNGFELKWQDM